MKFPQFLPPPFPYNKMKISILRYFYTLILPYRIKKWYREEIRPLFCSHKETYIDFGWSYCYKRCNKCYEIIETLRKNK